MKQIPYVIWSIVLVVFAFFIIRLSELSGQNGIIFLWLISFIGMIICTAMRLKDMGKHPAWCLLIFIPIVSFILWVMCVAGSSKREA